MRLKKKSRMQRMLETVGDALDAATDAKSGRPT